MARFVGVRQVFAGTVSNLVERNEIDIDMCLTIAYYDLHTISRYGKVE